MSEQALTPEPAVRDIELVFKPHPQDHAGEVDSSQTRYIKTTANATGKNSIYIITSD
jgi:hypothetical protein